MCVIYKTYFNVKKKYNIFFVQFGYFINKDCLLAFDNTPTHLMKMYFTDK